LKSTPTVPWPSNVDDFEEGEEVCELLVHLLGWLLLYDSLLMPQPQVCSRISVVIEEQRVCIADADPTLVQSFH